MGICSSAVGIIQRPSELPVPPRDARPFLTRHLHEHERALRLQVLRHLNIHLKRRQVFPARLQIDIVAAL
jgi:hypothetical protein